MADLLSKDMIADLILNIINILVLFFVTKALLYKPVKKFLNARKEKLDASLSDAQNAEKAANESKAKYDALLSDAEAVKAEAVKKAETEARQTAQKIIDDAKSEAKAIVEKGNKTAEAEHKKMIADAKDDIVDAALDVTEKLLGRSVKDEDNRRIIDSFFS